MSIYLVELPLQGKACSEAIAELKCDHKFDKFVRSIGIPVDEGELKTVAYESAPLSPVECVSPTTGAITIEMMTLVRGAALVRRYEAQAAIARRDAQIAMLEEELSGFRACLSELVAKEIAALKGGAA